MEKEPFWILPIRLLVSIAVFYILLFITHSLKIDVAFGEILGVLSLIGLCVCPSLGIYFLGIKMAPKVEPALSWIPLVRLYPLVKSAGLSGWWVFSFLVPPLWIYVYFRLCKKIGKGVGTALLLFVAPHFVLAYVGLREANKPLWPAYVFGISVLFLFRTIIEFAFIMINTNTLP